MTVSRLDVDLVLQRAGWMPVLAAWLIVATLALETAGQFRLQSARDAHARKGVELRALAAQALAETEPVKSQIEQRLDAFRSVLCEHSDMHRLVAMVFSQAAQHGITLAQAQYKLDFDKAGGFYTYQLTLPLQGSYPRLRRFVDATLYEARCAALEEVQFRREGIGTPHTEARLRFVLYLKEASR
jgi:Tfp pilus assembly protein PilO